MLSAIGYFLASCAVACGFILAVAGCIAVAQLFVEDLIERHERRCHRNDRKRTAADTDER